MPDTDALLEVVVVLYRSLPQAERELRSMAALVAAEPTVRWTFVDNGPGSDADRIGEWVGDAANVSFLRLPNPGFAAACNAAVKATDAPWILLLNPDILLGRQQLERITETCRSAPGGTSYAISQETDGFIHAGVAVRRWGWFDDRAVDAAEPPVGPSGGAALLRRSSYVEAGALWDELFAWGEDADLALRLRAAGVRCEVLDLRLPHLGGHSVQSVEGARRKAVLLGRNRLLVARRNLGAPQFWRYVVLHAGVLVALTPRNLRRGTVTAAWRGFASGLRSTAFAPPTPRRGTVAHG